MSGLERIGVRVESIAGSRARAAAPAGIGGGIAALAFEIAAWLERLAAGGDPGAIDLRSLPMSAADRANLKDLLGCGEVEASLHADGVSLIRETAIEGVWWSEYRDPDGEMLAEVIEICGVPEILVVPPDRFAAGAARLHERIAALAADGPS
jgi:hydrogenase-1 operon protein HyaF